MRSFPWPRRKPNTGDADEMRRKIAAEVARKNRDAEWRGRMEALAEVLRDRGEGRAAEDLVAAVNEMQ